VKIEKYPMQSNCLNCAKKVKADAYATHGFRCEKCGFFSDFEHALEPMPFKVMNRARMIEGWKRLDKAPRTWAVVVGRKFKTFISSRSMHRELLSDVRDRFGKGASIHVVDYRSPQDYHRFIAPTKLKNGFRIR
jgi:hypothetical protein